MDTQIELSNDAKSSAIRVAAADFLRVIYPTTHLLIARESVGRGHDRHGVLLRDHEQGKSHLRHRAGLGKASQPSVLGILAGEEEMK